MMQHASIFCRIQFPVAIITVLSLAASVWLSECIAQEVALVTATSNSDGVLFSENGHPILQYQAKPKSHKGKFRRANYFHPLFDLNGDEITEDFPEDHLHQRGIFWAWHQVKVGEKVAGNSWLAEDFDWVLTGDPEFENCDDGSAKMRTGVQWQSTDIVDQHGAPQTLVLESTTVTVWPEHEGTRLIDFDIQLIATLPDVSIAGSDDVKGYGGFCIRAKQPDDLAFRTLEGVVEPEREQMQIGNWIDLWGSFGKTKSGLAVFVHPSSSGFPQDWILRGPDVKSMQNPVFPGREPVPVPEKEWLKLRYRIVLHEDMLDPGKLNELYQQYRGLD